MALHRNKKIGSKQYFPFTPDFSITMIFPQPIQIPFWQRLQQSFH